MRNPDRAPRCRMVEFSDIGAPAADTAPSPAGATETRPAVRALPSVARIDRTRTAPPMANTRLSTGCTSSHARPPAPSASQVRGERSNRPFTGVTRSSPPTLAPTGGLADKHPEPVRCMVWDRPSRSGFTFSKRGRSDVRLHIAQPLRKLRVHGLRPFLPLPQLRCDPPGVWRNDSQNGHRRPHGAVRDRLWRQGR